MDQVSYLMLPSSLRLGMADPPLRRQSVATDQTRRSLQENNIIKHNALPACLHMASVKRSSSTLQCNGKAATKEWPVNVGCKHDGAAVDRLSALHAEAASHSP